jgi:hypothetical protein
MWWGSKSKVAEKITEGIRTFYRFVDEENVNKVLVNVLTDNYLSYKHIGDELREIYPIEKT